MKTGKRGLPLSSLPLPEEDQRNLAVSLWTEGLLEVVMVVVVDEEEEEEEEEEEVA